MNLVFQELIDMVLVRGWHHILRVRHQILDRFIDTLRAMFTATIRYQACRFLRNSSHIRQVSLVEID